MVLRRDRFGNFCRCSSSSFVTGQHLFPARNHASTSSRSYVKPDAMSTGSCMTQCDSGQMKSGGTEMFCAANWATWSLDILVTTAGGCALLLSTADGSFFLASVLWSGIDEEEMARKSLVLSEEQNGPSSVAMSLFRFSSSYPYFISFANDGRNKMERTLGRY